jgi:hypothetical protein
MKVNMVALLTLGESGQRLPPPVKRLFQTSCCRSGLRR